MGFVLKDFVVGVLIMNREVVMIKVGDRFKTIRGEEYVVVEYLNYNNVTVEFCDKYQHRLTTSSDYIKSGQIKNPYSPRIFGVGYWHCAWHKQGRCFIKR